MSMYIHVVPHSSTPHQVLLLFTPSGSPKPRDFPPKELLQIYQNRTKVYQVFWCRENWSEPYFYIYKMLAMLQS